MTESPSGMSRGAKRLRAMLWSIVLIAVAGMLLPLSAYVWTAAVHADEAAETEGRNPRSEYWREVRESEPGYTAVRGQETNVLIQSRGETWRELRNGPVKIIGAIMVVGILLALLAYHLKTGGAKLEHRTGRKILRWSMADRVLHWYTAVLFIVLAITGLSLLWGRTVLIPLLGKEGFAAWANLAKPVHDYLALAFTAGLVVMLVKWFHHNLPASYDRQWLKQMGGYLDGSHPPAGFANAGEKAYYWTLVIAGAAMVISGFYLLFPNFGFERAAMQTANIVHGASALILVTFVCLHIYLGTLGSEGAFEGMVTGEVDEAWARQHHSVWLDEVQQGTARQPAGAVVRPAVSPDPVA
ncbi:MAG TPA: formate dehydrogenase subunit gamma [Steroidobacteraceae bacterium]|nr:formate dehydrogenase subunit gamma [Steroidobacteraceae bacterium]